MRIVLAVMALAALALPATAGAAQHARDARVSPARLAAKACKAKTAGKARRACVASKLRSTCRKAAYRAHRDCRAAAGTHRVVPVAPAPAADPGPPAPPAGGTSSAPADPAAPASGPALPGTIAPPTVTVPPALSRLQVTAREFSLTPSRTILTAGVTRVELANFGEDPHDLHARPAAGGADAFAFPSVGAGEHHTEDVSLSAGTWTFDCALPEHELLGMQATITVR
ncbi:MAG: hypothetical protein QOJ07_1656 [Thermoleophilaceae bacterium]|nr:hypothetical protein [Thermoleophilaceae bacterium]